MNSEKHEIAQQLEDSLDTPKFTESEVTSMVANRDWGNAVKQKLEVPSIQKEETIHATHAIHDKYIGKDDTKTNRMGNSTQMLSLVTHKRHDLQSHPA